MSKPERDFISDFDSPEGQLRTPVVFVVEGTDDKALLDTWFGNKEQKFSFTVPSKVDETIDKQKKWLGKLPPVSGGQRSLVDGCLNVMSFARDNDKEIRPYYFGIVDRDVLVKQSPNKTKSCPAAFPIRLDNTSLVSLRLKEVGSVLKRLCPKCADTSVISDLCLDESNSNETGNMFPNGIQSFYKISSNIYALDRYEMENYLLEPDFIIRHIKDHYENDREPKANDKNRLPILIFNEFLAALLVEATNILVFSVNERFLNQESFKPLKELVPDFAWTKCEQTSSTGEIDRVQRLMSTLEAELKEKLGSENNMLDDIVRDWTSLVNSLLAPLHAMDQDLNAQFRYLSVHASGKCIWKRLIKHFSNLNKTRNAQLQLAKCCYHHHSGPPPSLKALINVCLEQAGQPTLQ